MNCKDVWVVMTLEGSMWLPYMVLETEKLAEIARDKHRKEGERICYIEKSVMWYD